MTEVSHVTRCPHCDTSFRVTDAQLEAAAGSVRCGACLQVFAARDYLLPEPLPEPEHESAPEPPLDPSSVDDESDSSPDEMASARMETADQVPSLDATHEEFVPEDVGEEADQPATEPVVGHWSPKDEAEDAIDDTESDIGEEDADPADDLTDGESDRDHESGVDADTATVPRRDAEDFDGELPEDLTAFSTLHDLDDVDTGSMAPVWRWWLASAALIVVGVLQYLWHERHELARDPAHRDAYLAVCVWLPCQLSEPEATDALGISSLIIRSHDSRDDALTVDALLYNDAPFRQPFPDLRLRFSSLANEPVAARIFDADEYLGGEMAGLKYIPAQTEVRISIDILDPGPDAVNYSLETL